MSLLLADFAAVSLKGQLHSSIYRPLDVGVQSSHDRIVGEKQKHGKRLIWASLAVLALILALAAAIHCFSPLHLQRKLFTSLGLIVDIVGASLVAAPLFRPYKDPVAPGMQFLSQHEPFRTQAIVKHQERMTLQMQIGLWILVLGFSLQLIANWI